MKKVSFIPHKCDVSKDGFCEQLDRLFLQYGVREQMIPFVNAVKSTDNESSPIFFTHDYDDFELSRDLEFNFFKTLLGEIPVNTIYKYTSWETLLRICSENTIPMTSVLGMNDSSEYFYANEFMNQHGVESVFKNSDHYLIGANTFITSFSLLEDNLTMWRLYGNDAKGISLGFMANNNLSDGFYLAPVSYANEDKSHPKLELIAEMQKMQMANLRFRFDYFYLWQNFFKPYDYKIEKEVRLLYSEGKPLSSLKWVKNREGMITDIALFSVDKEDNQNTQYPLQLRNVFLGPEFDRKTENKGILKIMLRNLRNWSEEQVEVKISEIDNYRSSN